MAYKLELLTIPEISNGKTERERKREREGERECTFLG
jgi:hypothetical protein